MKDHAQVVVIGGGVVGCSILYHLASLGWRDVMLLERTELTAGSTWHAAGIVDRFDPLPNLIRLRDDSIRLYERLARNPDQPFAHHRTGGVILATSEERLAELKIRAGRGRPLSMPHVLLSRREVLDHHPLINLDGVQGGLYDPLAGHVDPYDVTHALARSAVALGAEIVEQTAVLAMSEEADRSWLLITDRGEIAADVVVNAAGLWARDLAAMIGIDLPVVAIEHQYVTTDPIAAVRSVNGTLPFLCEPDASFYLRREGDGLLLGAFDAEAHCRTLDRLPAEIGRDLPAEAPERLTPYLALATRRLPCLADAAVKAPINGLLTMTPDGRPLLGPLPGLANYFVACGFQNGLSLAGGVGAALAEWIVEGEPPLDMFALDVTRFGAFARRSYAIATARQAYSRHYAIAFPHDRPPAGRPLKRTAIHDKLAAKGAQFDALFGWERPCWFAECGAERRAVRSFGRGLLFEAIGRECRGLRRAVGIADLTTAFAKHVIEGPGAETCLDQLLASDLPRSIGGIALALMLNRQGRINGMFTLARISDTCFYLLGGAATERFHQRWFEHYLPADGVVYAPVSVRYAVLAIAGPKARILLSRVTEEDVSDKGLPDHRTTEIEIAGSPARVMRVSATGDLGYEIHLPMEYQATVYEALFVAGQDLGLIDVGAFALESLRLEAGYDRFGDAAADLTPDEVGLASLVAMDKDDFLGRTALSRLAEEGRARRRVLVEIDAGDADALGGEPVYHDNAVIGSVIAGGYGHNVQMSLAQILVPIEFARPGTSLAVDILGSRRAASVLDRPPFNLDDQPLSI